MHHPPAAGTPARAAVRVTLAIAALVAMLTGCAAALAPAALARQASGGRSGSGTRQTTEGQHGARGLRAAGRQRGTGTRQAAESRRAAGGQRGTGTRQSSPVSVVIDSVTPRIAGPGKTVKVTGTVTNTSGGPLTGLSIQLDSSGSPFTERDELANYASGSLPAGQPAGSAVPVQGSLGHGATASWRVSLPVNEVGMSQFGVYPLAAEAVSPSGAALGTDRTFLPFWPGSQASGITRPLKLAWIWPLTVPPQQGICPALTSGRLAASVRSGGRLGTLLSAGASYAGRADLTWAVDPGLLNSVSTMTAPYTVGSTADCSGGAKKPASAAASHWLSALRKVASGAPRSQMFVTPYDDVDVAALTHQGLDKDLTRAYAEGRSSAGGILGRSFATAANGHAPPRSPAPGAIAWPADGLADSSVLGNLAVNGIGTVVLNASEMTSAASGPYTPDEAVTSAYTSVGTKMNILLSDNTLTSVLGSGTTATGSGFAVSQRFLAETAMIAAEAPGLPRAVVVAPPRSWNPPAGLADSLLSDTVSAPWLRPASLAGLAASPAARNAASRQAPPAHLVSPAELSSSYLRRVRSLDAALRLYKSVLDKPGSTYLGQLDAGLAATESGAWRGGPAARGRGYAMLDRVADYVSAAQRKVRVINSVRVTLSGSSGTVPVSIRNGLKQDIQVRLQATGPGGGRLAITRDHGLITIGAGQTTTAKLYVHTRAVGENTVDLRVLSRNGTPLPGPPARLSVQSTQFGDTLLAIIASALGVLVVTVAVRAVRRGLRDGQPPDSAGMVPDREGDEPTGTPGSAGGADNVEADSEATDSRDPPEVPDDYADERGWVRRT